MIFVILNVIYVMIIVMYSEAVTLNMTYTHSSVMENYPLTLKCSYTGLHTDETITRVSWDVKTPNELYAPKGTIRMPACTAFGFIDIFLYSFSCEVGFITWTILNITRHDNQHTWRITVATTINAYEIETTLDVQVPITTVSMTSPENSTMTINAGDSEMFKCRTSGGLPQATIKWFKLTGDTCSQSGTELTSSVSNPSVNVVDGLREVESTLTLTVTDTDNGRRICCTASNFVGMQRMSGTKILNVRYAPSDPPVIEGYASGGTYNMIENSTERLTCSSTGGNPLATLTWNCFNNQMFNSTEHDNTVKRVVQWTARRNKNARCTCTASHAIRTNQPQTAYIYVNILYYPSTPLLKMANTDVGNTIRIVSNSTQTVECDSSDNPSPTTSDFTWRNGTYVVSIGPVLNWPGGVKIGDEGSYTCSVETTLTPSDQSKDAQVVTSSSTVEVSVLDPPGLPTLHLDSTSGPVIEGPLSIVVQQPFTLACTASSKPPASYTWAGGVNVVQGHLLHDTLTSKVNVVRSCIARTTLNPTVGEAYSMSSTATVTINVNYPPKLQTLPRGSALEGNSFFIQCLYTVGNPVRTKSTITRTTDGTSWIGDSLTIHSISRADAGLYRCIVENTMNPTGADIQTGTDKADFEINVWYNTSISRFDVSAYSKQNIITVNELEQLKLVCEVLSNPNSTIQLKENHKATILIERNNAHQVEYLIQKATCSDTAVYTCFAFNNYTYMERAPSKDLQLFVRCSPRPSNHPANLQRFFTGFLHGNVTFVSMMVAYPLPEFKWQMWNGTYFKEVNGQNYVIFSSYLFTSLTILDIKEENFVSYSVQVSNGIQPDLQDIFHLKRQVITTTSEEEGSNQASLSGGVIGGCLGIIFAVVVILLLLRRKYACSIKMSSRKDVQTGKYYQESDNPGFNDAVTYEIMSAKKESTDYDALNAGNDRPDKSHMYMSLDESTSTRNPHCENSKSEDPVYNNTMLENSVQTVL